MTDAVLQSKRLLVLFPGYAAPENSEPFTDARRIGNTFARLLAKVRRSTMRDHVRFYRNFYANPRSPAYMAERLQILFDSGEGRRRTLILGSQVDIGRDTARWATEVRYGDDRLAQTPRDVPELAREHDTVLLIHSDALGLGLGSLERSLVAAFPGSTFVLNGRRRLYQLDRRMQRRLGCSRVLAETRVAESALALLVPMVGWVLASFDRLARRRPT